jgi:hypothetical protein
VTIRAHVLPFCLVQRLGVSTDNLHRHDHPSIMIKQAGCSPIISLIWVIPPNKPVRRPRWPSSRMVSANEEATSYASLQDSSRPRRGEASFVRGNRSVVNTLCIMSSPRRSPDRNECM